MIKHLYINNFRCFRDFSLEIPGGISILCGRRDTGKTSLFEALMLICACSRSSGDDVLTELSRIRQPADPGLCDDFSGDHLFCYKPSTSDTQTIRIQTSGDDGEFTLQIAKDGSRSPCAKTFRSALEPLPSRGTESLIHANRTNNDSELSFVLTAKSEDTEATEKAGYTAPSAGGTRLKWESCVPGRMLPVPVYAGTHLVCARNQPQVLNDILKSRHKQPLLKYLQKFDPALEGISVAGDGSSVIISRHEGLHLPLSMTGSGTVHLVNILCAILGHPGSLILIDEVDRGLHYSDFPPLWEMLKELASALSCQVLVTTQSYECLQAAADTEKAAKKHHAAAEISYIRLGNDSSGCICAHPLSADDLVFATGRNIEFR